MLKFPNLLPDDPYHNPSLQKTEQVKGGYADNKPDSKFNPSQLKAGIKVELEHTKDPRIAKEIAKDHILENDDKKGDNKYTSMYYSKLKEMEDSLEKGKLQKSWSEFLEKALYNRAGNLVPEHYDVGRPHPDKPEQVGKKTKTGDLVWAQSKQITQNHHNKIAQNFDKATAHLSNQGKIHAKALHEYIKNDPNHDVIKSGTTKGASPGFSEMRLRHFSNALSNGQIKETPTGIEISQTRHSGNEKSSDESTSWHFDGKTLKSFTKDPIRGIVKQQGEHQLWQPNQNTLKS